MKKIISIILIILMTIGIIIFPNKSNANFEIDSADLYSKGVYSDYLRWGGMGLIFNYVVYTKDGKEYPAYCLNKDLDGVTENSTYAVSTETLLTDVNVWRAIINGYPYKTPQELGCATKEEAFFATKQAVYCMLYNRDPNTYSATDEVSTRTLNALIQIVTNARNSKEVKQSAELTIKDVTGKWEQDCNNKEYISKIFTVSANAITNTYNVTLEGINVEGAKIVDENNNEKNNFKYGENFKIIMPITNMQEEGNFNIKVNGKVATKPVLYGYSANRNLQDYAITGNIYEDGEGSKIVNYTKNETKIIILKKEEENSKALKGVQFELLDENKNVLKFELTTDENGQVIISNLAPGKYFIEETKTIKGYELYKDLIEADVKLNEELTVTITNQKQNIEIEKPEILENNIEVVAKLPKTGM